MSYRPITDFWFLARAKLKGGKKYYGAYLGGFPERARALVGCTLEDPVLHVCGGMAKFYPYKGGFGPNDKTLDLDPQTEPDYLQNALDPIPDLWRGMILDPPYSEEDADKYAVGSSAYPSPGKLVENCLKSVIPGGKVGIIHYALPRCPKGARFVACVGVACGFQNRIRCFSVFERPLQPTAGNSPSDSMNNPPVNRYKVIREMLLEDFEAQVTKHLAEGWELVGGLAISPAGMFNQSVKLRLTSYDGQ